MLELLYSYWLANAPPYGENWLFSGESALIKKGKALETSFH